MKMTFRVKIMLSFIILIMTAVTLSSWYFYSRTNSLIVNQMAERVEDVVKTGTFLLDNQDRRDLANLIKRVQTDSKRKVLSYRDIAKIFSRRLLSFFTNRRIRKIHELARIFKNYPET